MTGRLLASFLISAGAGALAVGLLWPGRPGLARVRVLKASLAAGLGLGLTAEIYFLWLWTTGASRRSLPFVEATVLAALAAGFFLFRRRRSGRSGDVPEAGEASGGARLRPTPRILAAAFAIALVPACYALLSAFLHEPQGGWDAWMSWNLKARFFFRAGDHWRDAFSGLFWGANPSYPVFLPSAVARSWLYAGREIELTPALVGALFTAATVALASSALGLLRSGGQAFLAGLLLVATPFLVEQGAAQTADVPLGFFLLAAIASICLQEKLSPGGGGLLALAGLSAGFAAWTKNEGLLFVAALLVSAFWVLARRDGVRISARRLAAFAAGLLAILPLVIAAKIRLAPLDPLLGWEPYRLRQLLDLQRYWTILKAFGSGALEFGQWPVQLAPLLAFYGLLLGVDREETRGRGARIGIATLGLVLAGYFAVFLTSIEDLAWHLKVVDRLFLQLWPSAVFLFFLLLRTPEQISGDVSPALKTVTVADGGR
jgi:hypothetical protein